VLIFPLTGLVLLRRAAPRGPSGAPAAVEPAPDAAAPLMVM
jgi:hypothetical protein